MIRRLTPQSTLESLKKEAKRWLKALRANDRAARARLERANPDAPGEPGLRDVQHALAREHGLPGWTALKSQLGAAPPTEFTPTSLVARFLANACPDHHVRGGPAHRVAIHTAGRLLERYPEIARDSIYTAVVCGEIEAVERVLAAQPEAASQMGGPKGSAGPQGSSFVLESWQADHPPWEPLLYLCFTRLARPAADENAVAIARLLLDHGADPNAYFMAGDSRYTPLVGIIGEGEEHRPPHPRRDELVRLLLDRGAEPYDGQVVYNIHFRGAVLWFLKLIYDQAVKLGRQADWNDPDWSMLDMGAYGSGARWHLNLALKYNDLDLAEWVLTHGASPNAAPPRDRRFSQLSLRDEALRAGQADMAELLARFGARHSAPGGLEGLDAFVAASLRLDRDAAQALAQRHPEFLRSPKAMQLAAEHDRADVAELLLDLGMSPDVRDPQGGHTPLHVAAYNDSARVAGLLIERGAQVDVFDRTHRATALWWAIWDTRSRMIELLSPFSRDVWSLSFTGNVERLRAVLGAEPELAKVSGDGETPLMLLPDDEARAIEIVQLFLAHGADPAIRHRDGTTAAERASHRGLERVAELLRAAGG